MIALPGVTIQSRIYESSNSLVYRGIREEDGLAHCCADTARVVVKLLKQDYPSSQELTRYRQEYQITRSLNLEGVVKAYSQQDYQRTLVILLEDFGGESIEWWMRNRPDLYPMPLSSFLQFAIDLTDTLGRVHSANIIHKDINPGNIVLNLDTGVVKIIDFGIATQFNRTHPTFKSPHVLEGTLAYLSPEQTGRMNRLLDYRTDFYSLGVTFYQLLTGQLPFPTTDSLELVHCHIAKQPVPPHELNTTIPKPVSEIILKLMAKNAEDRYQSAWGIKADLECCAEQFITTGQINPIELGLQDVSDQFHIPQKLYGREVEIGTLLTAFDRVAARENSRFNVEMMLVSGYAGIGKSVLVQELYKPITAKRGYFISGKFDQFQRNIPYSAIAHALQKLVQQLLGEPDEQVQQWRSRLLTALGNNGQLIVDVIPEIELIIGKQSPVPEVGATEAQNRFNRVFQSFMRVFCSKEHPLVIFLDDLQWIDSATLKLIELIMLDEQIQSLFLIGAYRDNEVNSTHPLLLTLDKLIQQGAMLQEIVLAPLTLEPLSQLIAETLHQDIGTVRPLAQLVLRKTEGNPFFVNEFLRMLYGETWLTFDTEKRGWQWNIAQIQAQNITDNVVELLLLRLKKLPEVTQQILRLAACIGAEFDLETLAIVCEQSPAVISLNLLTAIQAGLIQPLSELDENLLVQEYKFLHDRVQQAAYALIDDAQKQIVHLQIGRNLFEKTPAERLPERLFEIVDHLNYGIELVTEQSERDEIARLNLMVGQKAKAAIAHRVAEKYLATGRAWLAASSWQTNYDLTLALYSEMTEVAYLCGEFEQVEHWSEIVLQNAKTVLDTVKVYEVKIQTYTAQKQPSEAINTALQVLQQLEISFPETPTRLDVQQELNTITHLLRDRQVEALFYLPDMTESVKLAAMRLLSKIMIIAYISAPHLMPLLTSKLVSLSIQYGNASVSCIAYAGFGVILHGIAKDIEAGYEFGQLALKLLSRPDSYSLKAQAAHLVHYFVIHRKKHTRETLEPLLEGYQSGLETGDLGFASFCIFSYCFQLFAVGKKLAELENEIKIYSEIVLQSKQEIALSWLQILHQSVLNLIEHSTNPTFLIGESYDERNRPLQQEIDGFAVSFVHLSKLILCYSFSQYAQAVENSKPAASYFTQGRTTPIEPLYYLYNSLAKLATYSESNPQLKAEILEDVAVNQKSMKQWAHYASMNYLHKYHLVEAEKAQVLSQWFEAEELYEQAIQGARENEYLQEEALAYELAAKHYLARGRQKIAQTYMKEAHYCYERWGATTKVKDLETRYPQFFSQSLSIAPTPIRTTAGTTSNTSPSAFDLATVMKASQAIAREIELDQLLRSLMQILIENAGAQTGYLILENAEAWVIEASCELNDGENVSTQVLQSIPIANRLPESIIQYVIRTQESVLLNDATRKGNFTNDPYIQHNQTQSLLCLPLLNQSKLVSVLYLENQLATGVFTPERSQVLNLLSTQAAIAIENAKLYSELHASKSRVTQFLEAIPLGVAVVDTAGRPYYFNQRATQLTGKGVVSSVTMDQLTETYQTYLAGTNQKYPTEKLNLYRALRGERTRTDDLEIHQGDTIIPVEIWGTPVFDEQGNVVYAIATFQDITERKQAEAQLAKSETLLRTIVQSEPECVKLLAADGVLLEMNPAGLAMIEADSLKQVQGQPIYSIAVEKYRVALRNLIKCIFQGESSVLEFEIIGLKGTHRWLETHAVPLRDQSQNIIALLAVTRDITERKQSEQLLADYNHTLEQQVAERTAALQASEAALRHVFDELRSREQELRLITDALPVCISYVDANQRYQFINRTYEIWFQCSRDEFLGKHIRELLGEESYQIAQPYINQALAGQPTTYEAEIPCVFGKKYTSGFLIPNTDSNGQVRGYYGLITDISDRKRAETASILEERNRMAREIHDTLAQSFTGILIHARSAANQITVDPDKAQDYLVQVQNLAQTGLSEARRSVEALRRPYLLESNDLLSAFKHLTSQLESSTGTPVMCEAVGIPYPLPSEVENNLLRIGQEALTNALRYAKATEIQVELIYQSTQCILRIKDDGQGFALDHSASHSSASHSGFGLLGMAERAALIGAQIQIQSAPGQGTEIVVSVNQQENPS
ncbi:MAG: AAA family ATPase [Leptolyngbyaceae cyanobacterium bins.302]|nr:AAA family ATPase [Leptolyngbyaceae cyanobacterium bins.302]